MTRALARHYRAERQAANDGIARGVVEGKRLAHAWADSEILSAQGRGEGRGGEGRTIDTTLNPKLEEGRGGEGRGGEVNGDE